MAPIGKPSMKNDPNVTLEDQTRINQFSKLHARFEELNSEIKQKSTEIQNMNDACDDIMLLDDGVSVPVKVGESFVHMSQDDATTKIEQMKEALEKEVANLKEEVDKINGQKSKLRTDLKAKFGDAINLDSSES